MVLNRLKDEMMECVKSTESGWDPLHRLINDMKHAMVFGPKKQLTAFKLHLLRAHTSSTSITNRSREEVSMLTRRSCWSISSALWQRTGGSMMTKLLISFFDFEIIDIILKGWSLNAFVYIFTFAYYWKNHNVYRWTSAWQSGWRFNPRV